MFREVTKNSKLLILIWILKKLETSNFLDISYQNIKSYKFQQKTLKILQVR